MDPNQHERNEQKAPFPLTAESREPTKSKDEIVVEINDAWSALRSGRAGRAIYVYDVRNLTKRGQYSVELFEDDNGKPFSHCQCPASVFCKHGKAALEDLLRRVPDFGAAVFNPTEENDAEGTN